MIVIAFFLIGAILGWRTAAKRQGDRLDKLQYAAAYCLAFSVVGLIITVLLERLL
ncbi:apolipoprotein acyltransferase [Celeribacter sp.]|uniref:apolipoprotein acyltransferase n=1 Tax=Celeribacter sp. TaxID=1890673 RepID=UPI003A94954B